ncbi:MAG: hypothetical protein JO166_14120 [Deltaproteobacteria bacterium]|nr:hypothetical protein [Deltaproteobacteria bacterium]
MNSQFKDTDELIAQLAAVRQFAERLNLDFDQMLADALRKYPPDSGKLIRARLETLAPAAPSRH